MNLQWIDKIFYLTRTVVHSKAKDLEKPRPVHDWVVISSKKLCAHFIAVHYLIRITSHLGTISKNSVILFRHWIATLRNLMWNMRTQIGCSIDVVLLHKWTVWLVFDIAGRSKKKLSASFSHIDVVLSFSSVSIVILPREMF